MFAALLISGHSFPALVDTIFVFAELLKIWTLEKICQELNRKYQVLAKTFFKLASQLPNPW